MNKKIIAFFVSILYLLSSFTFFAYASESTDTFDKSKSLDLIKAVNPDYTLPSDVTHFTRLEFVRLLIDVTCPQAESKKDTGFSDVESENVHASSLVFAKDMEIVSSAAMFYPDENVTYTQAIKMAVTAAGYKPLADVKGGYPTGYLTLADDLGLTEGLSSSGDVSLTIDDGLKLITNLFDAIAFIQTGISDSPIYEAKDDITFLYHYHKIKTIYGTVTANEYSSVSNPSDKLDEGQIKIDTVTYKTKKDVSGLLGYKVKAYADEDNNLIYADKYDINEVMLISSDIGDTDGFSVIAVEGKKEIKYSLNPSFKYIKNGKAAPITVSDFDPFFMFDTGTITLVDNDGDRKYDVAIAKQYSYSFVTKVSAYEKVLYDANSASNTVVLNDEAVYTIKNSVDGTISDIKLNQIPAGVLVAYAASDDGLLFDIIVLNDVIEGKITAVDSTNNYITVNDTEYKTADYYNTYYSNVGIGTEGTFCIGIDGKIAAVSATGENYMKYGFFVAVSNPSGLSESKVKIFSQSDKMEILTFADNIMVNNSPTSKAAVKTLLQGLPYDESRFIKFSSNSNGELKKLDISDDAVDKEFENPPKPSGDSLTKFTTGTYRFKTRLSINVFTSSTFSYHIDASTVNFIVPSSQSELMDDSAYGVISTGFFVDDRDYSSMSAYDVDKSGCAGATIHFADIRLNGSIGVNTATAVVEKITTGLDPDGDEALLMYVLRGTKYEIYYSDAELSKNTISTLNPGDLVRFVADNNNVILRVERDFSVSNFEVTSDRARYGDYVEYVLGIAYSASDSYVNLLTNPQMSNHRPVMPSTYGISNIRNINVAKATVIYVDLVMDSAGNIISALPRVSEATDIKSYLDSGNAANVIVARQYLMTPTLTVVYNIEVK